MCGIAGIYRFEQGGISETDLSNMISAVRHRGPDEFGLYMDDRIGLAHARLSIVDLGGGRQPIANEDKTLWIVFNGEIFNFLELREGLRRRGHVFASRSDTEVILHLYEEKGVRCLDELNGQFAFAIWDSRRQELFLARDRVGIVPLYYTLRGRSLLFASEIKSLLAHPEIEPRWNFEALDQVFTYWTPLPGQTVFDGVFELKPGHCLMAKNGRTQDHKYWGLPAIPREGHTSSDLDEAGEAALHLLEDAVRIRLQADVEVGCYLSGGLDSSILSSLAKRQLGQEVRTFGVGFEQKSYDESDYQKLMAGHLQVEHAQVTATDQWIGENFERVIWHCEKPLLRMGPVPLYRLSMMVRERGLKVVLTGEGADEVFGGYNIFREALVRRFWAKRPDSPMRSSLIQHLYAYIFDDPRQAETMKAFFRQGLEESHDPLFSHLLRWRNTSKIKRFYSAGFQEALRGQEDFSEVRSELPEGFEQLDTLTQAQYLEMTLFMSNYLLSSQGDRIAMANSVELRVPFLDHRLIEFMARVPSRWKILGLEEKFLLRRMFRADLPRDVLSRPKQPYRAPISSSLKACAEMRVVEGLLSRSSLESVGLFDGPKVELLKRKLLSGHGTSQIEDMALAGIISTMMIHSHFMSAGSPIQTGVPKYSVLVDRRSSATEPIPG